MQGGDLWLVWARGALLAALGGHWIANLVLDDGPYQHAGLSRTAPASLPILIQTIVIAVMVLLLRPSVMRPVSARVRPALQRLSPGGALAGLVVAQVALFVLLEATERLAHHEPISGGGLSAGFLLELLVATTIALVLAAIGMVAVRAIASARPRRRPASPHPTAHHGAMASSSLMRVALELAGGVRGPPPVPAVP